MLDQAQEKRTAFGFCTRRDHLIVAVTLLAFVILAGRFALVTPIFEMPEEPWHLRRIAQTAGKDLPPGHASWVQAPEVSSVLVQPPLYYWLGASVVQFFDWDSDPSVYELNPHARLANLYGVTNRNVMLARVPSAPGGPLSMSVMVLRMLSVLAAAVGLLFVYRLMLGFTMGRRWLAWTSMLMTGFLPGYAFLQSGISPFALGSCLGLVAVFLALRTAYGSEHQTRDKRLAFLFAGLTAMTIWWGWTAVILVLVVHARQPRGAELRDAPDARGMSLIRALMVAMALVWPAQLLLSSALRTSATIWQTVNAMGLAERLDIALRAYWGLFGWLNIPIDNAYYTAVGVAFILGASGLILRLVQWYWNMPSRTGLSDAIGEHLRPWQIVAILWALLGTAVAVIHLLSPSRLFLGTTFLPLAPFVALFLVLGMDTWVRTYGAALTSIVAFMSIAMTVVSPGLYVQEAYKPPLRLALPQVPVDVRPLDVSYGDSLYLVGYRLKEETVAPGGYLPLTLYWLARTPLASDYTVNVTVLGEQDDMLSSVFTRAGSSLFPTSMWTPGDVIVQDIILAIDSDAEIPVAGTIGLTVTDDATGEVQQATDPSGEPLPSVLPVTRVRIGADKLMAFRPAHPLDVSFDGQMTLTGYSIFPATIHAGCKMDITLYWRAEGPLLYDYTVFVHMVDSAGVIVAQGDSQPRSGSYPTGLWLMGEQVSDTHAIEVPLDAEAKDHWIEVGIYRLDTGERLLISGQEADQDHYRLGPFSLSASE